VAAESRRENEKASTCRLVLRDMLAPNSRIATGDLNRQLNIWTEGQDKGQGEGEPTSSPLEGCHSNGAKKKRDSNAKKGR